MSNNKFCLTDEKKVIGSLTLFRIKALISFSNVEKGELGGFVEKESNLDSSGNAWVSDDAQVYGDAWVSGNAWVSDDARVSGDARVYGDARVSDDARVSGDAQVYGKVKLTTVLCSRFSFEFDWQIELWQKKETEYKEEIKKQ